MYDLLIRGATVVTPTGTRALEVEQTAEPAEGFLERTYSHKVPRVRFRWSRVRFLSAPAG